LFAAVTLPPLAGSWRGANNLGGVMAVDIIVVELQAIAGGLQLAKRTLDDVLARVTVNPGPINTPGDQATAMAALASIIGTAGLIVPEAQQIQTLMSSPPAGGGGSAPSSIEVKKEVAYLDDAARARLAEETMGLKLATYKYKSDDARQRLGFILEDSPNVAAADMTAKQVDLYAYTSMVVATVQQQQAEIDALKAEVERLKK
jgi:hypothetical protein